MNVSTVHFFSGASKQGTDDALFHDSVSLEFLLSVSVGSFPNVFFRYATCSDQSLAGNLSVNDESSYA
jgi:hypothetical protein